MIWLTHAPSFDSVKTPKYPFEEKPIVSIPFAIKIYLAIKNTTIFNHFSENMKSSYFTGDWVTINSHPKKDIL